MKTRVHIAFCSGRRTVREVAGMLARQLRRFDHCSMYNIHLAIFFDPHFQRLSPENFRLSEDTTRCFEEVSYCGPDYFRELTGLKATSGIDDRSFEILFRPRGYCSQKNAAFAWALLGGAERLLFLDDDEYFVAPFRNQPPFLHWKEQDIFGLHMSALDRAEITNGLVTGYPSPIPADLDRYWPTELRQALGKALSKGNEIIDEKTFLRRSDSIRYGNPRYLKSLPHQVEPVNGVRFMTGGNVAFHLGAVRQGRIPPYFNPVGARGEDAILGSQIPRVHFHRVPACVFHDPLQRYVGIPKGLFPSRLEPIPTTSRSLERFCQAFLGWLRYAPLLLRLTTEDAGEYEEKIDHMCRTFGRIGAQLDALLGWRGFHRAEATLSTYHLQSHRDLDDMRRAQEAWGKMTARS